MLPISSTLIPNHHSMNTSDVHVDHGGIEEVRRLGPQNCPPKVSTDLATVEAQKLILALGLTTELAQAVVPVLIRNLLTLEAKQKDYGPHNLTKFGSCGVVVRMGDKMERIINLAKHPRAAADVCNEPLSDSFLDMANYSLIGYVMQQNIWPE